MAAVRALGRVFSPQGLLAPKFDHTPFRTPESILGATTNALSEFGPFGRGLDVCCGTGAGMRVLGQLCRGPITGVDFSAGMLAQARTGHPDATWVRADARALPFAEDFDLAVTFGALGHFLAERPALFEGVYPACPRKSAGFVPPSCPQQGNASTLTDGIEAFCLLIAGGAEGTRTPDPHTARIITIVLRRVACCRSVRWPDKRYDAQCCLGGPRDALSTAFDLHL
jgi:SAM-dependent methyltransferase